MANDSAAHTIRSDDTGLYLDDVRLIGQDDYLGHDLHGDHLGTKVVMRRGSWQPEGTVERAALRLREAGITVEIETVYPSPPRLPW